MQSGRIFLPSAIVLLADRRSHLDTRWEHGRLTIAGFQELCPGISRRTLQRDIRVLTEKGLLLSQGRTSRLEDVLANGEA